MSIICKNNIFYLSTPSTSYIFGLYEEKLLLHLYYGKRLNCEVEIEDCISTALNRCCSAVSEGFEFASDNVLPMEFSTYGSCDLREPGLHIKYKDGSCVSKFSFMDYKITKGKPKLKGLPSSYVESDDEADTLEIKMLDKLKNIVLILRYTVYNTCDIITKSISVINNSEDTVEIKRLYSSTFDIPNNNYELITLSGSVGRECLINRNPLFYGYMSVGSRKGASSHQHNPFMALAEKDANEKTGDVYGFSLVYSGNFTSAVEVEESNLIRVMQGINDFSFGWQLKPNDSIDAPEVVLTYSDSGIGKMSRTFNEFVRTRICRGNFRDNRRPILINSWESTYFDFDEEKILGIAKKASEAGIELFVLDDGWFGKRNDDKSSLGDWYPNLEKLPNGIKGLCEKINALGMKFGLWFEPEMISKDSDLYRKHPDWCIHIKGRYQSEARNQLVLDLSRKDVCDYIIDMLTENLTNANIEYVKWDMNRNITELGSALLPKENQQEVFHRYILGLYRILDTITNRFPNVLFEGCASGGGRFDLGALCYFPQIWASDDSDAMERLKMQYSYSLVYPVMTLGAHVSAVPNHQVGRTTPLSTRYNIALMGAFGYELDLNNISDEEFLEVKKQVEFYKKYSEIINKSQLYRLKSPFESNGGVFEFVSEDKKYIFLIVSIVLAEPSPVKYNIKLQGIGCDKKYREIGTEKIYNGEFLKKVGLFFENKSDFSAELHVLKMEN